MWKERREVVLGSLENRGAVAIIPTNPEVLRSGDSHFRFRPDSNFFYLTGFPEAGAVAVLTPWHPEHRFVLFVRPRNPELETWNGRRAGVEGARSRYGADVAYPIEELAERLPEYLRGAQTLYYPLGHASDTESTVRQALATARRFRRMGDQTPSTVVDPDEILAEMRLFKSPAELDLMQRAADITVEAHIAAMQATRPGAMEYELQALIEYVFRSRGAMGPAYPSIVGAGANGTILHYIENDAPLKAGELLLVDAGAEFNCYAGDLTRTWPISGQFSGPQRDLYDVVLSAQLAAIEAVKPGNRFNDPHDRAVEILTQGMIDLGLLAGERDHLIETQAYRRYYMHKTGHWLGLDVHDIGSSHEGGEARARRSRTLAPGMITTVEPGLYIPADDLDAPEVFRGVGIRIEDDVVVTTGAPRVLTEACPKHPSALEALVGTEGPARGALRRAS